MPKRRSGGLEVRLTRAAQRDIKAILNWTRKEFGQNAVARYQALIQQAVRDIGIDPERPGSQQRPDVMIEGARTHHLEFSRSRMGRPNVKAPRHLLVYRRRDESTIEVARVLHDALDLPRHLPAGFRRGS